MLALVAHQVRLGDGAVGVEQLGKADPVLAPGEVLAVAQQEPATALDDLARRLIALQAIGLVDVNTVDDLATVLRDDVEEVEDDLGVGAMSLDLGADLSGARGAEELEERLDACRITPSPDRWGSMMTVAYQCPSGSRTRPSPAW